MLLSSLFLYYSYPCKSLNCAENADVIPAAFYLAAIILFCWPYDGLYFQARSYFLNHLRKVFVPSHSVPFSEVLLADGLTSLSKVLTDFVVSGCVFLSDFDAIAFTNSGCTQSLLVPIMASLPYALRARQCLRDYSHTGLAFPHLVNCMKYFSAFPVIWIPRLEMYMGTPETATTFQTIWYCAAAVNTLYSFAWDFRMDWGLGDRGSNFFLLRNNILYPPVVYYVAIIINFLLRCIWSLKLPERLHLNTSQTLFMFELLEVMRRCMWNFIRVEWQHVRAPAHVPHNPPAP
eukprot:Colp12_sorted_trinity150504_noHs@1494